MSIEGTRTSQTHPIEVNFLESKVLGLPGRLGMTILPGVKHPGRWDRELELDLDRIVGRHGADTLVVLLEDKEFEKYGVPGFLERARDAGLEVVHFPIRDVDTPKKAESAEYAALIGRIVGLLGEGKTVVTHCRGGIGRTGTVAASVLVALGYEDPNEAIEIVRSVRDERAVETPEQEEYVREFAREFRARIKRYRGCLLGLAAGDALGTTVEFEPPGSFEPLEDIVGGGPFGLEPGQWTDDTSMALCLAESLVEKRAFDPADQLTRYVRWYREGHMSATGECFDIGNATRQALKRFEETGDPYSGSTDPHSAGNGSIMRLAPVALFYAAVSAAPGEDGGPSEEVERAGESSRTTHGAPTAVDACRYLGGLISGAANGASKEELLSELYSPQGPGYWKERPLVPEIDEVARGSFKRREPPEIQGSGYVVRSLEAALWAFYNSASFKEGALMAVNLGDDADTTGAVYGQLAGAFYGEEGIPASWLRKVAERPLIERLAEGLLRPSARGGDVGPYGGRSS